MKIVSGIFREQLPIIAKQSALFTPAETLRNRIGFLGAYSTELFKALW